MDLILLRPRIGFTSLHLGHALASPGFIWLFTAVSLVLLHAVLIDVLFGASST